MLFHKTASFTVFYLFASILMAATTLVVSPDRGMVVQKLSSNPTEVVVQEDVYKQLLASIKQRRFAEAEEMIDDLLDENQHDHQAHMLRKALANALIRARRTDEAEIQFKKFLDYLLSGSIESRGLLKHLPQVLINLPYVRQNIEPKATDTLTRAIDVLNKAVADEPKNIAFSSGLTTAINLQARGLHNQSLFDEMQQLYSGELDRLRIRWRSNPENPDSWLRLAYLLKVAAGPKSPTYQEFAKQQLIERSNLLAIGAPRFPDSSSLVREYVSMRLDQIDELQPHSPRGAKQLLTELAREFEGIRNKSTAAKELLPAKIQIEKELQRVDRQLTRKDLIGQSPPSIANTEWLQGQFGEWNFPNGGVILCFFSAGNRNSLVELKKINALIKDYARTTTLLAITHEFEQSFDQLSIVRRKPGSESNKEVYRGRIKKDIIQANEFEFAVGIVKDTRRVAAEFGISELPFMIAIDPSGVCRQVFQGTGHFDSLKMELERWSSRVKSNPDR